MGQIDKKLSHLLIWWKCNEWKRDTEEEPQSFLANGGKVRVTVEKGSERMVKSGE